MKPQGVTYYYKLKGYDSDWVNAGNMHTAHYTNLNNGAYTFQVKAIDHTGRVSENIASLSFIITPPFWKETWFIALVIATICGFIFWWIRRLQQKIKTQVILNKLATSLYGQSSVHQIFVALTEACRQTGLFENCYIYQLDMSRRHLIRKTESGISYDTGVSDKVSIDESVMGEAVRYNKALKANHVRSEIAAPIYTDGIIFAILYAVHHKKRFFSGWHFDLAKEIAAIGSVKIERYFAEEQIRNKVSRDLHDDMGSTLSSINILSKLAISGENGNFKQHLFRIAENSSRAMESMNDIVWSINPNNDSLEQLLFKMKEVAGEMLEPKNINYFFEENIDENLKSLSLDANKRKNIFLIFKEAVNNAAKYSEGDNLKIEVWREGKNLNLKIEDNGKGFDIKLARSGNGLKNMEVRSRDLSAVFEYESIIGKGTRIFLSAPIP